MTDEERKALGSLSNEQWWAIEVESAKAKITYAENELKKEISGEYADSLKVSIMKQNSILAAAAALKEKDAQLCKVREDFQFIIEYWNGNSNLMAMENALEEIIKVATAALSSSGPCPHEEEAKRLRIDLSKPPQEREYCVGCSLPGDAKRLREAVERAGWHLTHNLPLPEFQATHDATMKILKEAGYEG